LRSFAIFCGQSCFDCGFAALRLSCPPKLQRRRMLSLAKNQLKCLAMNNLHQETRFPNQT
jgi:hypothetical protein